MLILPQGSTMFENVAILVVLIIAFLGLAYALFLRGQVMKMDKGDAKMQQVWNAIRKGANAYLNRQLKVIIPMIVVLTVVLFLSVYIVRPSAEALERFSSLTVDQVLFILLC